MSNEENPLKLLIVEDESVLREILKKMLAAPDRLIVEAEDGLIASDLIKAEPFDAVISDISMPNRNGIELLEFVRSENLTTPFLFLTAYRSPEFMLSAIQLQAFDFLEKPFSKELIKDAVSRALELGRAMRVEEDHFQCLIEQPLPENILKYWKSKKLTAALKKRAPPRQNLTIAS